ncbi:MAG: hypothetical protein AAF587_35020 [Bacteroidota bacterium]
MKQVNRYRWTLLSICVFALGWGNPVQAQYVEARILADTTELRIGEQVNVKLSVSHDSILEVQFPLVQDTLGGMEILDMQPISEQQLDGKILLEQQLTLIAFDSGYYRIPPQDVYYFQRGDTARKSIFTNAVALNVFTIEVDTTQAIKPIKGIEQSPLTFGEIAAWGGIVLGFLAIIAAIVWYVRKRRQTEEEDEPRVVYTIPPYEVAMRELAKLEELRLWQKGEIKSYYIELTDIVRTYIEGEFQVPAMESVTHEIIADLGKISLPVKLIKDMKSLLEMADLAKFAKLRPDQNDNLQAMERGRNFLKDAHQWNKKQLKQQPEKEALNQDDPPTSQEPITDTPIPNNS